MPNRPDISSDAQHAHGAVAQHGPSSEAASTRTGAQHGSSTIIQHGPWQMDDDDGSTGVLGAFLDEPIPYRLSHEAGVDLDAIDPNGSVP